MTLLTGKVMVPGTYPGAIKKESGGRYWDRTSGFHRVKVALYR